jgi:hypothetical protein
METDKIIEKLIKWLSDPKGREMFKTIVYLILPLVVLLGLRGAARRKSTEKGSAAIKPRVRPSTHEAPSMSESLRETMARERAKVKRELQEVFGREDTVLTRAKKEFEKSTGQKSAQAESPEANEKKLLQDELLKLFSRRPN